MDKKQNGISFYEILMGVWKDLMGMCIEARKVELKSDCVEINPTRLPTGTAIAISFAYSSWQGEEKWVRASHAFMADLNFDIAWCEGTDFRQAKVEDGQGSELLLVLNQIQYTLALELKRPQWQIDKIREYIEKGLALKAKFAEKAQQEV